MFSMLKPAPKTESAVTTAPAAERRTTAPRVDICETAEAVLVVADMPGVAAEGVEVRIHGDVLTLHGRNRAQEPERFQPIWREYALRDYERSFRLGQAIDVEHVVATAKEGVVRITLPKQAEAQAKRITVTAG
jgi:HSP20 family protein